MNEECVLEPKERTLNFFGSNPGAVKHGNFINYYCFHNAQQRINNLHPQMFPKANTSQVICLDIGCNTGELTKELFLYLKSIYPTLDIHVLGVDIDLVLVQRAKESYNGLNISFEALNVMDELDRQVIRKYLKKYGKSNFDITFCFSVTMWIHLNGGDEGLLEFLRFIKTISNSILIEPQPWNCYRNAQRRVKKSGNNFELYNKLKIRSNVDCIIENILIENSHKKVYESTNSSWNRKIQSYHSREHNSIGKKE